MRMISTSFALASLPLALLLSQQSQAFLAKPSTMSWRRHLQLQRTIASMSTSPTHEKSRLLRKEEKEEMKRSIETMKQEAKKRLEAFSKDLSDYEGQMHHSPKQQPQTETTMTTTSTKTSVDELEGDLTKVPLQDMGVVASTTHKTKQKESAAAKKDDDTKPNDVTADALEKLADSKLRGELAMDINEPMQVPHADVNRLDDTRWKIAFDIGREPGTWMPPAWGASGDRLRFSLVVDLTSEPFLEREEFFDGVAGAKVLNVVEANLGPTFWDSENHGQQQLKVAPKGAYRVLRGAGPLKTDALRFFIETEQEICKSSHSDVACPKGRIYGNCGYFPIFDSLSEEGKHRRWIDILSNQYNALAKEQLKLQKEGEEDDRLFSLDSLKRMKESMHTRKVMGRIEARIQEFKQMEPERSELRLSRKGDVGLSRSGGACLKVQKGLAVEYHILGRIEVASVKEIPEDHEDFESLKHKLHP